MEHEDTQSVDQGQIMSDVFITRLIKTEELLLLCVWTIFSYS
jgi:hypothetical protein